MTEYTAQEAEAEGVRPLREEEVEAKRREIIQQLADNARMQERVKVQVFTTVKAEDALSLIATLDAARAELERKEAEAAALREHLHDLSKRWHWVHSGPDENEAYETCTVATCILNRHALNTTQAGADLLERVRQLEGELELGNLGTEVAMELEFDCKQRPQEISRRTRQTLVKWQELRDYQRDHQGTGAAGEEE